MFLLMVFYTKCVSCEETHNASIIYLCTALKISLMRVIFWIPDSSLQIHELLNTSKCSVGLHIAKLLSHLFVQSVQYRGSKSQILCQKSSPSIIGLCFFSSLFLLFPSCSACKSTRKRMIPHRAATGIHIWLLMNNNYFRHESLNP